MEYHPPLAIPLMMPLRMMPPFVPSALAASGKRGVTASVPLERERLAVDDLESTALDLPLAWHRICRLRDRDACCRDRALRATTSGACLSQEWRVVEARLVAVSRDSDTEPVLTAAEEEGTSSPDDGVSDSEFSLESSDAALARADVLCWRMSSCWSRRFTRAGFLLVVDG